MISILSSFVLFLAIVSIDAECTTENIDIIGSWDVTEVKFVDTERVMEKQFESQGKSFDDFHRAARLFEEVEFQFKENNILYVVNPEELGESGETVYSYVNGQDKLTFGGQSYKFEVLSCEHVIISQVLANNSIEFKMYCERK